MLQNGEIIDNTYQIMQKIGSGGTGDVYLAYHIRLQKYVVVKKIKDNFVGHVNVRAEVDILKRLRHTYLPQVYDFIQRGTQVYTVMDYIEGSDLEAYIQGGYRMEEETVLKWLRQLCEVLEYLHSQVPPIIHSDIKPANIMITTEGNVCLIDFNISFDGDDSSQISGISLPYASPEQYTKAVMFSRGQEHRCICMDGRTDMYSLAAAFYHLLTGFPPAKPYENKVSLKQWELPYSEGLVSVIDRAMQTDVSMRYENMGQMLKAVNSIYKHTRKYKLYLMGVICSSVLYLVSACFGIWCLIHGMNLNVNESFETSHKSFMTYYETGDYDKAIDAGYAILNENQYNKILKSNKTEKALILHTIGECYFENEEYEGAAEYYGEALEYIPDIPEYSDYCRDYVVALVRCGQVNTARVELEQLNEIQSTDIDLIQAEILVFDKEYSEAVKQIERLIDLEIDNKTRIHLLVLGSNAATEMEDYETAIQYLERAREEENTVSILRKLGIVYMDAVKQMKTSDKTRTVYLENAKVCYLELSEKSYASLNDSLNLAICYRALEEYKESIKILKELEVNYSDYRIYMHLAFAYDKAGNSEYALKNAEKCLVKYNQTPDNEKESMGSDNMQSLKELEKKYK